MAIKSEIKNYQLKLSFVGEMGKNGKAKTKTKVFNYLNPEAEDEAVVEAANILQSFFKEEAKEKAIVSERVLSEEE